MSMQEPKAIKWNSKKDKLAIIIGSVIIVLIFIITVTVVLVQQKGSHVKKYSKTLQKTNFIFLFQNCSNDKKKYCSLGEDNTMCKYCGVDTDACYDGVIKNRLTKVKTKSSRTFLM